MKIKVAFFVYSLEAGGIERYLLRFLNHYIDDIDATVYCKSGRAGVLEKEYKNININVIPFKVRWYKIFDWYSLTKEYEKHDFDAVVDFTNNFAAIPLLMAKVSGVKKRIVWYRNADVKFEKTFLKLLFNKIINYVIKYTSTDVLSNSIEAFNVFFKGYNWQRDKRFEVIYNGINANEFSIYYNNLRKEVNIPDNSFVVGHIGRFNEQKNHKTAIEVATQLCAEFDDIYFVFVGRNVDIEFSSLIKDRGIGAKVLLLGNRGDIPLLLNTFDCFYFPSILEGNPNALIEAMISGVPFVASDIPSIKETVPFELHDFLIPPLDVSLAKTRILEIKNNVEFKEMFLCKDWALNRFDAKGQFSKFYIRLK